MIRLDSATRKLQIVLGGAITTAQLQVTVNYYDETIDNQNPTTRHFVKVSASNSTTDVDICLAPRVGFIRNIDTLTVYNADSVAATVTIKMDDSGTETILVKRSIATLASLHYEVGVGWYVSSA